MTRPLRTAVFVGAFPVISETFITRQIAALLDSGHDVDIYADSHSGDSQLPAEIATHHLLERTIWMDMQPETAPWEMPIWPLTATTWPPGSEKSVHNLIRLARAVPALASCLLRQPRLTRQVLRAEDYGYQARSLSALYRLRKLCLVRPGYDVLHAHFGPVAKSFRFARQLWRAPLVASFHGYDFSTVPRKEGLDVYDSLFRVVDLITVNSDYTRQQVQKLGCPSEKIRKLPVGLSLQEFPFSPRHAGPGEPIRFVTVGRLVGIKGHEYVLRALAQLRSRSLTFYYDIVGDGPLRSKLEKLADDLGIRDAVVFHGARGSSEVSALLSKAHIFVLASVTIEGDQEGQGLVVQEAQASGLPVIVTRHGALPEGLLPGKSGFIVPERDVEAMAERLAFLSAHPEIWPDLGRQGRKFVEEHYDIRLLVQWLINIYREAVQNFKY